MIIFEYNGYVYFSAAEVPYDEESSGPMGQQQELFFSKT